MFQYRFKKWNKKIWIAKKIGSIEDEFGYEYPIYERPELYKMNVQPINSAADIAEFGENSSEMQKAVIELKKYIGKFKEYDVAYLDGISPFSNGGEMNFKVKELDDWIVKDINGLEVKNLSNNAQPEYYTCPNANYRLYPPRNQNKVIQIYFKKTIKDR